MCFCIPYTIRLLYSFAQSVFVLKWMGARYPFMSMYLYLAMCFESLIRDTEVAICCLHCTLYGIIYATSLSTYMQNLEQQFPWLTKIPQGSHGKGKYQRKLWKCISDTVRIRDFCQFKTCISCNRYFVAWKDAQCQAGHFRAFGACRGFSKWDTKNIFAQCGYCNTGWNANPVADTFKQNIISRHGQERMDYIDRLAKAPLDSIRDFEVVLFMREVLKEMKDLPEQPDYWHEIKGIL